MTKWTKEYQRAYKRRWNKAYNAGKKGVSKAEIRKRRREKYAEKRAKLGKTVRKWKLTPEERAAKQKKYAYDRYWNHREKQLAANKKWREENAEYLRQWKKDYNEGKKNISKADRLKRCREQYKKNRDKILKRKRKRRQRPDVKAKEKAYYVAKRDKTRPRLAIIRHKSKKNPKPGFLYYFESITPGYYKVGWTTDWKQRRQQYAGPTRVKRLFFVRPVKDMAYAEIQMKLFMGSKGFKQKSLYSDWLIKEDEMLEPMRLDEHEILRAVNRTRGMHPNDHDAV